VLLFMAWTQAGWIRVARQSPDPLAAVEDMVQTCVQIESPGTSKGPGYFPSRSMDQRVVWVLELLERRENMKRGQALSDAG
jgi:hypothetical protein